MGHPDQLFQRLLRDQTGGSSHGERCIHVCRREADPAPQLSWLFLQHISSCCPHYSAITLPFRFHSPRKPRGLVWCQLLSHITAMASTAMQSNPYSTLQMMAPPPGGRVCCFFLWIHRFCTLPPYVWCYSKRQSVALQGPPRHLG